MSVALFARELGGAGAPPIVILHGLLGSSRNWQTVGRDLAAAGRVVALDLRNQGQSPHTPEMTYDSMVEDVLTWLDEQRLPAVTLLGHSLGGKVAMRLACLRPARVARLIIVDIAPKVYGGAAHRAEFAAMSDLQLEGLPGRAEAELRMEGRVPDWAMRKFLTTNLERTDTGWRWSVNLPALVAALPELVRNPLATGDRYEGPTRFIVGGRSQYVQREDHAEILRHFPAAQIQIMPDCGHNPHIEAREAFVLATGLLAKAGP